jgi:hypothetical protein
MHSAHDSPRHHDAIGGQSRDRSATMLASSAALVKNG